MPNLKVSPSECLDLLNQSLNYAFHGITVVGEVSSLKLSKGQYIFFDLKDEQATLNCFTTPYQLNTLNLNADTLEDGTVVEAMLSPKVLTSGRLSFTVIKLKVVGEGLIKNQLDELKLKYQKLGFLDPTRKRSLPYLPSEIAVISSKDAAGWKDFLHILNLNWPAVKLNLYNSSVQGQSAAAEISKNIERANQNLNNQMIVIIRGGGSSDDLSTFNSPEVIEQIFGSNLPVLVGVGHKIDVTLAELTADRAAATPTDAANIIFPSQEAFLNEAGEFFGNTKSTFKLNVGSFQDDILANFDSSRLKLKGDISSLSSQLEVIRQKLNNLDVHKIFDRGFLLAEKDISQKLENNKLKSGDEIKLKGKNATIRASVKEVIYEKK